MVKTQGLYLTWFLKWYRDVTDIKTDGQNYHS